MFKFDNDDMSRTVVRFSYENFDDEGNVVASVTRTIRDEDAEYLPSILEAFMYFLQGMTFTYVDNVVATHESGAESSAVEV
jgi:hypothetical protein